MARPRRTSGTVFTGKTPHSGGSRYRDREGQIVQESTATTDRQEAERFLRKRLDARDDGSLPSLLASKNLTFSEWAEWYLEKRSKPPFRSQKTHLMNINAIKLFDLPSAARAFRYLAGGDRELFEASTQIWKAGSHGVRHQFRGKLKPMTVHQEFRVLSRILNVAVKQKRLASNPCTAVEFPVPNQPQNPEASLHDLN